MHKAGFSIKDIHSTAGNIRLVAVKNGKKVVLHDNPLKVSFFLFLVRIYLKFFNRGDNLLS